jgi:hypothetical protein
MENYVDGLDATIQHARSNELVCDVIGGIYETWTAEGEVSPPEEEIN